MFGRRRVWTTFILVFLLVSTSTGLASAQSPQIFMPLVVDGSASHSVMQLGAPLKKAPLSDVYIVLMSASPVVRYAGEVAGLAATAPQEGAKVNAASVDVQNYVAYLQQGQEAVLASAGVGAEAKLYSYTYALNGFAAHLTPNQAKTIAAQPGVTGVMHDQFRSTQQAGAAQEQPAQAQNEQAQSVLDQSVLDQSVQDQIASGDDNSLTTLGLADPEWAWRQRYTGEGVLVGIIDTGIWPEHPSFADDGSYPPLPSPAGISCDFGNSAHNGFDVPFTCNNKLIGAYQFLETYKSVLGPLTPGEYDSARDNEGHGTHTASTVAGNANVKASIFGIYRGRVSGIAPRARIIAYKALGDQGGFDSDLAAAIDQAVADGVDVINYSIGGGANLLTADGIAFLNAADAGVFVAASAGNDGPDPGTIGSPAAVPWVTAVGANFPYRQFISDVTLSGPGHSPRNLWGGSIGVGFSNYNLVDAEGIADITGDTSGQCLNAFAPGTFQSNDAVLCDHYDFGVARVTRVANVKTGGGGAVIFHNVPSVNVTPTDNHILPTVHMLYNVGMPLKRYLAANKGKVKISATAGQARYAGQDPRVIPDVMTSFSSRGPDPVAPDIIKPDVTAPGYQTLAGESPHTNTDDAQGQFFQAIMGTSMSGPHVAGLFALLKQAHPDWSPAEARSALMTTASQRIFDSNFYTPADPFDMGAGGVNASMPFRRASMFQPGLAYDAGLADYLGFLCGAVPGALPDTTCATLVSLGISTDASDLNLPSIGVAALTGSQVVSRTLTSVASDNDWHIYRVSIDAPRGYDVSVTPNVIRLRRGQTATYNVTITNKGSAPTDEWRFGSLTWVERDWGRDISVRSPIAVLASLLDAPGAVDGVGESGALNLNVKFGYTGNYLAQAHGLVAATVTNSSVKQDPDQSFDPDDGFSDLHTFSVSSAVNLRVAIPPDATDPNADLDIYVFDPTGALVGASFNAGTNELVDIPLPMDGEWKVYVHGWQASTSGTPYTMYSWIVPATTGGSLQITSAPTSVTSSSTANIGVSWGGATSGQWYLGAVSHNRDSDVLGLTLVNIDNR